MPIRVFPLRLGERPRLKLEWQGNWKNLKVSLDKDVIGTISTRKNLVAGQEFTLKDGSVLKLKLSKKIITYQDDLKISIDGEPLEGTSSREHDQLDLIFMAFIAVTVINLAVGIIVIIFKIDVAGGLNKIEVVGGLKGGLIYLSYASVMILLGFLVVKLKSLIALGIAYTIFSFDTWLWFKDLIAIANSSTSSTYNNYNPSFSVAYGSSVFLHFYVLLVFSYGFSTIVKLKRRQKGSASWLRWI
jgi:hypothetical protein